MYIVRYAHAIIDNFYNTNKLKIKFIYKFDYRLSFNTFLLNICEKLKWKTLNIVIISNLISTGTVKIFFYRNFST